MSGDYSRHSFDPRRDFCSVLLQQGRVALDSDWNEMSHILDRRLRAETVDIIGRCIVPRETPLAFLIAISGAGGNKAMTIGRGRMYVHGLLAENHGDPTAELDLAVPKDDGSGPVGVIGEVLGTAAISYDQQPHFPQPPALPQGNGPHLVYLDVWQREVTYLEDERLLEKALGGVDTTTRMQTVWQVKVLADVGDGVTCATPDGDIESWVELTRPTAGRLSTRAMEVDSPDDPCKLPPGGGYSGLENQLYRVEIHDAGAPGTATFKWSRDNATVATAIESIPANNQVVVTRIGRDDVLRFNVGDWVEVTDDLRELHGVPGAMLRIDSIQEELRRITFAGNVPADLIPSNVDDDTPPARHLRLRRWDQAGEVRDVNNTLLVNLDDNASGGVIPIPAAGTTLVLAKGVEVTFDVEPADGAFRAMNYWCFAARTADRSVEELDQAPPKGIHHHYCRLAVVTFPETVFDCRVFWPPVFEGEGCGCSVCVTADSHNSGTLTIQNAVDQVRSTGGTICMEAGAYVLGDTPVIVEGAQSVRIVGRGFRTHLTYSGTGAAITVRDSISVTLEEFAVTIPPSNVGTDNVIAGGPAILLRNCLDTTVQRCVALLVGGRGTNPAIALEGYLIQTRIRENAVFAPIGIASVATGNNEIRLPYMLPVNLSIVDNVLACQLVGVNLGSQTLFLGDARIAANSVITGTAAGIVAVGPVAPGSRIDIESNILLLSGHGIVVGPDSVRVVGNDISRFGEQDRQRSASGIFMLGGNEKDDPGGCQIIGNRVMGVANHGIHLSARVGSVMIKQNEIVDTGGSAIFMDAKSQAEHLSIENNVLQDIAAGFASETDAIAAIRTVLTNRLHIAGNTISRVAMNSVQSRYRAGIDVMGCRGASIRDHAITEIGPIDAVGYSVAIQVHMPFSALEATGNLVRRSDGAPGPAAIAWYGVRILGPAVISPDLPTLDSTAPVFLFAANLVHAMDRFGIRNLPAGGERQTTMRGNNLSAWSASEVVQIQAAGSCVFTGNQCLLEGQSNIQSVVIIDADRIVAGNNIVRRASDLDAMILITPNERSFTVLGNITFGNIRIRGGGGSLVPLPPPWSDLNVLSS